MDRRSTARELFTVSLAGGAAAVIGALALPEGSVYFTALIVLGSIAAAVGLIGLLAMLVFPGKKPPPQLPAKPPSTSLKVRGKGKLDLEDFVSTADIFADADNFENITVRRGVHAPNERDVPKSRAPAGSDESNGDDARDNNR